MSADAATDGADSYPDETERSPVRRQYIHERTERLANVVIGDLEYRTMMETVQ